MLQNFVLPPLVFFIFLALGYLIRRRHPTIHQSIILIVLSTAWLSSTPLVATLLLRSLQWYPAVAPQALTAKGPQAIVILAAGRRHDSPEYGGDTVDALTLERVRYGAFVARMTGLPVILSGGPDKPDQLALSDLMREVLETELRVSPMWVERKSQTTAENARYVSEILRNHGIAHIYLVTHAWHMPRAAAAFRHMNVTVTPAPTGFINNRASPNIQDFLPSPWALSATGYALHEWLGLLWYTLRGDVGDGM